MLLLFGQASSDGASFTTSSLGLAAVFLIMLGLVARAYLALQRELASVNAARVADGVAHAAIIKAITEEQTETLKDIAVVLDRVQSGLSATIVRRDTPTPAVADDIMKTLGQLAKNQQAMADRLAAGKE